MAGGRSVLAVDGNSLGHRGYHSAQAELEAGDERPLVTGAVVSMLATTWVHGPYDAVLVGFDHPTNRRKLLAPEYKANRPPTPPALTASLQRLRGDLAACGFAVVEHDGAEADDVMAAAVDACTARGWRCDVLSSDRDLTALVTEDVRLLRPRARFGDLTVEDVDRVRASYGISPDRYVELAALRGDASDGLEGARGIGSKTAAKLLRTYGSITALYEALPDLPPRIEASLREARDRVERNLLLMAPVPHLEVDVEALAVATIDPARVLAVLAPLGLDGAARRFERAVTAPPPPPLAPHPVGADEPGPDPQRAGAVVGAPSGPHTGPRPTGPHVGEQEQLF
jgi:5'-3' exonuclease